MEVAIILPVALLLLAGALDMGRLFFARVSIENAAREGAVFAANNPRCDTSTRADCSDPNTVEWRTRNEVSGIDGLVLDYTCFNGNAARASVALCETGDTYQVTVSDEFDFVTPILAPVFGGSLTLEASATSRVMNTATDPDASPFPWPSAPPPSAAPCTVPTLVGETKKDAEGLWTGEGFARGNFDSGTMKNKDVVGSQSIDAGDEGDCDTTSITVAP